MRLRKDKKQPDKFWFGRKSHQWVILEFSIIKIVKNIIFTFGGKYKIEKDVLPYEIRVLQISRSLDT